MCVRENINMNFLGFVFCLLMCCILGNTKECKLSAAPPDPKDGCCGRAVGVNNKFIGGYYAQLSEYPWMGIIEYEKDGKTKLLCSAFLISGRYMLSAAQCFGAVAERLGTPTNVRLGEYDTENDGPDCEDEEGTYCNDGPVRIAIEKVISHPEFDKNRSHQNDIALIRLAKTVSMTEFIQPICLPSSDVTLEKSIGFKAAGWGRNESASLTRLHHVKLPYVDNVTCQAAFNVTKRASRPIGNGQVCAGGQGWDTCKGDSGGPLMYTRDYTTEAAGITSYGSYPCGQKGVPSVYTKVYAYDAWIRANIEE